MSAGETRDPASVLHEIDYWQALHGDLDALNAAICTAARNVAAMPVAMLEILVAPDPRTGVATARKATREALDALQVMQSVVDRVLELSAGRAVVLRRELGLDPLEEPDA